MKAIVLERAGEASEVLALRDVEPPVAGEGEVVLEVEARAINPADLSFIRGTYRVKPVFPQIAGLSGVGRVVEVGPNAPLGVGARVAFRSPGAWAERVATRADRAFVVPDGISLDAAAQFSLNPITAWGLLDVADVHRGDWVGLTAPSSSVSVLARALADSRGVRVLDIPRADEAANAEAIRARTGGEGLAALLDCVGGPLLESLFSSLRAGATIVAYGTSSPEPARVRNASIVYSNLTWKGFGIDRWLAGVGPHDRAVMLDALWTGIRSGLLPLPVRARLPLRDFATAITTSRESSPGKVLLV